MKKLYVIDSVNYFGIKDNDMETLEKKFGKNSNEVENVVATRERISSFLKKCHTEGAKIVTVTRKDNDLVRSLCRKWGLGGSVYTVHDDLNSDDFKYVLGLIMSYFGVSVKQITFVSRDKKDLSMARSLGIECIDAKDEKS